MKTYSKIYSKTGLAIILTLFIIQNCCSQQVIWANKNNLDKRTNFTKVLGQNKYGVYVLKHKNSTFRRYFILEHFDKKMNLLKSKTFKIPNSELEKIVVHSTGILVFTREYQKGSFHKLNCQSIDSNLNEFNMRTLVTNNSISNEISDIRINYNSRRDKFLVWYLKEHDESTTLNYHLINRKSQLREGQVEINQKFSEIYIGDALIDDTGNLYMIYTQSEKFKSKSPNEFHHRLFAYNIYKSVFKDVLINDDKTFLGSYDLTYNLENGKIHAFGLTGEKDEDDNKGYVHLIINSDDFSTHDIFFADFERKLVSQILGIKNEQKGENLNKFKIKKIIPKTDGGITVICERMFITTQSDIFYVNGIPQSSYAKIFNNDEVLLIDLDSIGNLKWTDVINKNQSSINDGGYYNGIVIMINEAEINILYNDKLSANADIIQITYKNNGEHNKKILINNEQFYALVIPSEYNQVSSNSIVLPINQNRDFTYIKLLY